MFKVSNSCNKRLIWLVSGKKDYLYGLNSSLELCNILEQVVQPRRRLGLVEKVVRRRRLLVGEEALGRHALMAVPVVRVSRPRDRAKLGVWRWRRYHEQDPRRSNACFCSLAFAMMPLACSPNLDREIMIENGERKIPKI